MMLTSAPVLAYPSFDQELVLETDASVQGLGAVLSQKRTDDRLHPVAYASRALSPPEKDYGITDLETLAVVWAMSHFRHYLYGNGVTVYTDHTAVKSVLESPNPTGKHARWWTRVYGCGVKHVNIRYRAGRENTNADALSQSHRSPAPAFGTGDGEIQVDAVHCQDPSAPLQSGLSGKTACQGIPVAPVDDSDIQTLRQCSVPERDVDEEIQTAATDSHLSALLRDGVCDDKIQVSSVDVTETETPTPLLSSAPRKRTDGGISTIVADSHDPDLTILLQTSARGTSVPNSEPFESEQAKDPAVKELYEFLQSGKLPEDALKARKMALRQSQFAIVDGVVYYVDPKDKP